MNKYWADVFANDWNYHYIIDWNNLKIGAIKVGADKTHTKILIFSLEKKILSFFSLIKMIGPIYPSAAETDPGTSSHCLYNRNHLLDGLFLFERSRAWTDRPSQNTQGCHHSICEGRGAGVFADKLFISTRHGAHLKWQILNHCWIEQFLKCIIYFMQNLPEII